MTHLSSPIRIRRCYPILLSILLLEIGCGGGAGTPDGEDRVLDWEAEDVFTIGTMSGEEWETFARIAGVAFDGEGNLFLLDSDNFRVVKVNPSGALEAEMGGEGGGPGEFGMPMAISVTAAGEARVYDLGNGGFVRFNPNGNYAGFVPMDPELGVFPYGGLLAHPGGGMLTSGSGGGRIRQGPGGGLEVPDTRPVHLFSLGDEVEVSTVYEGWNPATAGSAASVSTEAGGRISFRLPALRAFDPPLLIGVLPDGRIAVADSEQTGRPFSRELDQVVCLGADRSMLVDDGGVGDQDISDLLCCCSDGNGIPGG